MRENERRRAGATQPDRGTAHSVTTTPVSAASNPVGAGRGCVNPDESKN